MGEPETVFLGLVAGVTVLLGLPLGRLRSPRHGANTPGLRVFLNATTIGILIFLVWDMLSEAWTTIEGALVKVHETSSGLWPVVGFGAVFFAGLGVGLLSLAEYERRFARKEIVFGPGAMAANELQIRGVRSWPAARLALMIAIGIGVHNFGEGLAMGGSAARGQITLAALLVIGFALHNATEGFGIVAPLAADVGRPGWGFLLLLGLIGGGPTVLGAAIGRQFTSETVSVVFLTLAAGSIVYVVIQLVAVASRAGHRPLLYWGIWAGLAAGFITDMILTTGGA
jgi:zinc transporter, ZIP family